MLKSWQYVTTCDAARTVSLFIGTASDMAATENEAFGIAVRFDDSLNTDALAIEIEKWLENQ